MTYYFKPCFTFFRKRGLALLLACLFASPAMAGGESLSWDPPARFAGEYAGELVIERHPPRRAKLRCMELGAPKMPRYGCAGTNGTYCLVVIPDRVVMRPHGNYMTPEAVLRHELGHCNGWPAHHPK